MKNEKNESFKDLIKWVNSLPKKKKKVKIDINKVAYELE